jgi:hypothetical protein
MKSKKKKKQGEALGKGRVLNLNITSKLKPFHFRCPLSKVDELKLIAKSKLSEWSQGSS